ncbi:MAG: HlyD family efflux transporter periplasmic adaptor subunit [Sedimenticolaceae bacterium]
MAGDVERWLDWQCQMISGVQRGAVYVTPTAEFHLIEQSACWPGDAPGTKAMRNAAVKAMHNGSGLIQKALDKESPKKEVLDFVAYPIFHGLTPLGVVVLAMEMRSEVQRRAVLQLVQWGAVWLNQALIRGGAHGIDPSAVAMQAVTLLTQDLPLPVVANQLCSLLADKLGCTHVGLGMRNGLQVQVVAVSHQMQFDRRVESLSLIEAAMEECIDQEQPLSLPMMTGEARGLNRAHRRLIDEQSIGAVCSMPIKGGDKVIGALTLQWEQITLFDRSIADLLAQFTGHIGPTLYLKQREERSLSRRLLDGGQDPARRLFGAGNLRLKVIAAALAVGLVAASLLQTEHRVSARSLIEGTLQQAVVAPMAGYLAAANARAGDVVEKDQVLAVLDDRELLLERDRQISERDKHTKEYLEALAARDRAKITVTQARVAQADAQLRLAEEQLRRTELRAPFAGTLVSGDLSRAIGAPLERGQLLFELVPSDGYRISLQVDEHDVAALEPGQEGSLRLAGLPDAAIPFTVSRIVPVATAEQGGNHFRVEAELEDVPSGLRPGMQGVAKVVVGRNSYLWVWTHNLIQRLRLWAWSIGLS